ncbi:uncharacterized protein LOC113330118 [Papaver somniferum]|uniref:uncharacterized protein LOC113330118 n=1 Tax=Papaver somniferum TaxID=3469 RepID=UPI000E6FA1B8|nr:uncharacterized protein LOC113330118 [Papaver somniferum]
MEIQNTKIRSRNTIQVYTLGSHLGWRKEEKVPHYCFFSSEDSGVFGNGAVHWINLRESQKCDILAFGLANEEFWPIPSPPYTNSFGANLCSKLTLLGGNLCVVHSNYQSINKRLDIRAFKKTNNGNSQGEKTEKQREYDTWSWSKEHSIAWEVEVTYTPFVITKCSTVLLWENETSNLRCFDPRTSTLEKYWDGGERDSVYVQAVPHMNSLVSLKELGEI